MILRKPAQASGRYPDRRSEAPGERPDAVVSNMEADSSNRRISIEHHLTSMDKPHGRKKLKRTQASYLLKYSLEMESAHRCGLGQELKRYLVCESQSHRFECANDPLPPQHNR